ncbi:four helix bundle protein [Bengtsoniella intestinalis]|uniref:four helix bundle protein n=1 Tax=Bengtsoniella intestinalis TaxID=3073143 RepID=UPI00391F82FE
MRESVLIVKSKAFALDIIKVCNEVKTTKRESVLTNQLIRSGTSVGAVDQKSHIHADVALLVNGVLFRYPVVLLKTPVLALSYGLARGVTAVPSLIPWGRGG